MFKGLLFALPLLFSGLLAQPRLDGGPNPSFVTEQNERGNYTLTGVDSSLYGASEIRIYYDAEHLIDEVSDTAFNNCSELTTLMLSYSVTHITDTALSSVNVIQYTGSESAFAALNLTGEYTVRYYAYDEGFIKYWNDEVRPEEKKSICDMTQAEFNKIYVLYSNLLQKDKKVVDNYVDAAGAKISESMAALIKMFKSTQPSKNTTTEWNQSGAITLIIIISVIGMTSICIFFLLKTKQIIS